MPMPKNHVVRGRSGRIAGTGGLTDQQRRFVKDYVANGGNGSAAARSAQYADPGSAAYYLTNLPKVAEAIRVEQSRLLKGDLANLSLGVLRKILEGTDDSPQHVRLRLDAAKTVLDRAGHVAPRAAEPERGTNDKPMSEWSIDELEAFIRKGRDAMDQASKPMLEGEALPADGAQASTQGGLVIDVDMAENCDETLPSPGSEAAGKPAPPAPRWLAAPAQASQAPDPDPAPTGEGAA